MAAAARVSVRGAARVSTGNAMKNNRHAIRLRDLALMIVQACVREWCCSNIIALHGFERRRCGDRQLSRRTMGTGAASSRSAAITFGAVPS
jgi:hypothetical protein